MTDQAATPAPRTCPWCSAAAPDTATKCPACGAALAQRESIAELVIPGVTNVDPDLVAYDARPIRLHTGSPSQSAAGGAIMAATMGGPAGLAALGGLAAIAAAEYLGARQGEPGGPVDPARVGEPSEAVRLALARLEAGGQDEATPASEGPAPERPSDSPADAT